MIQSRFYTLMALMMLIIVGCQDPENTQTSSGEKPAQGLPASENEDKHTHDAADVLTWVQLDIQEGDFTLSLGHHGEHFHGGDTIEPAVKITRGDDDVADAIVHNSLVAEDAETVLAEERPTVFEPRTDDEPAHYAQGALQIPKDAESFLIRFRIQLPGSDIESMYDIPCELSH